MSQESCQIGVKKTEQVGQTATSLREREKDSPSQPIIEQDTNKSEGAKGGLNPPKSMVRGVSCKGKDGRVRNITFNDLNHPKKVKKIKSDPGINPITNYLKTESIVAMGPEPSRVNKKNTITNPSTVKLIVRSEKHIPEEGYLHEG